ncbi:Nuclear envelope morphology protein 1 [Puccinia graminis f. sp. tritici]|uniref:Nuclear envelope morphology protein 1 n=1 Tax=Puccinia graminis f. sp. tritici TaxID=56615 RepID=A0A5B0R5C4_PUCGR|nr:Nuclear envelope morphology protein 1 [Puccinia graminis f. sp. tritici]
MNSLTWLLAPRRSPSKSQNLTHEPDQACEQSQTTTNPSGTLSHSSSSSSLSSASLQLGSGPRETEAELVDKMVHSIERQSGTIAANKLERKTSMGLDGELRFGLPGITERRRTLHLEPGPTKLPQSNHNTNNDPVDLINQSSTPLTPTPLSTPPPSSPSPIKLFSSTSSYNPYRHLIRLLPVRLGVKLYILIRKFISLFGLNLSSSSSSSTSDSPSPTTTTTTEKPSETKPKSQLFKSMWSKLTPKNSTLKVNELLPRRNKTLVLDLDETLIHSTSRLGGIGGGKAWSNQSNTSAGLKVRVVEVVLDGRIVVYHVYKRPWVDFFLKTVSSWYTVVIFTASMREYADPVIDWLDQGRGLIEGRLFRESCTNIQGSYVKDLTVVERDLSKVCLVDNSPISYGLHQANGIPIEGWLNDPQDEGLLELLPMLDSLRFTKDVRRILGLKAFSIEPHKI